MDKYEQLKQKIDEAKTKSLVVGEIKAFVEFMVSMVDKSKNEFSDLSKENVKIIKDGIAYIEENYTKWDNNIDTKINTANSKFDRDLALLKSLIKKVKTIKPRDGIDGINPDPQDVVPLVLKEIKLPEYKETILDGRKEIVEKINTGKTNDIKIEAKQIDGLDKMHTDTLNRAIGILDQRSQYLINKKVKVDGTTITGDGTDSNPLVVIGGGGGGHTIQDEGTPLTQRTNLNFVGSGVVATDDAGNDATTITIGGGGSTAWGDITGTLSDQTDLQSALNAITPNATHTGEVTGATDLTLHLKAIENRTDTDVAPDDYFLFLDATDTTLKKDTIQGILDLVSGGSGDVSKVGTPVDNQVGVWTGDGTIEGTSGLVFSSNALGIGGVGNVGAYSGSVATVRGSNSNIFEMIRDITSSDSLLGRFVAGNTSNSVSSSIDFRSGTVNNRGQIRLMTSNGTTNTEALRIDEAQKSTFYNGGVNLDYSTASRVPVLDASKNLIASSVTDTELGYVSGVTSAIQTQLNAKLASSDYDDATSAETNTGTSTAKYVSPDGLAGSYAGTKSIPVVVLHHEYLLTTGDGKLIFPIPDEFAGMNLVSVAINVNTTSSSGNPSVQIARGRQSSATSAHTFADILTTNVTIDATEYDSKDATTPAVIGATNDDVAIGDLYRIDVDAKGTGTKGLSIRFGFRLP